MSSTRISISIVSIGIVLSFVGYYFSNDMIQFMKYCTCNEADQLRWEELDRIEKAIHALSSLITELNSAPTRTITTQLKDIELDADFILEKLDSVGGSDMVKSRRKRLVQKTLLLTAQLEKIPEYTNSENV